MSIMTERTIEKAKQHGVYEVILRWIEVAEKANASKSIKLLEGVLRTCVMKRVAISISDGDQKELEKITKEQRIPEDIQKIALNALDALRMPRRDRINRPKRKKSKGPPTERLIKTRA